MPCLQRVPKPITYDRKTVYRPIYTNNEVQYDILPSDITNNEVAAIQTFGTLICEPCGKWWLTIEEQPILRLRIENPKKTSSWNFTPYKTMGNWRDLLEIIKYDIDINYIEEMKYKYDQQYEYMKSNGYEVVETYMTMEDVESKAYRYVSTK